MSAVCPACSKSIRYDDIRCSLCSTPFHAACTDAGATASSSWICASCCSPAGHEEAVVPPPGPMDAPLTIAHFKQMMSQFATLQTSVNECNTNTADIIKLIATHTQQIAECQAEISGLRAENSLLKDKVTRLEKTVSDSPASLAFKEVSMRLQRERNIVIRNIAEDDTVDIYGVCSDLLGSLVPRRNLGIDSVVRVGKSRSGSPRLTKVSFSNVADKYAVLGNRNQLDRKRFPNIDILNDLTPAQATKMRELREEVRIRKAGGEADLFVRFKDGEPYIARDSGAAANKRRREESNSPNQPTKQSRQHSASTYNGAVPNVSGSM